MRKAAVVFIGTLLGSFILYNSKISFDNDSVYSFKLPEKINVAKFYKISDKDYYKNIKIEKASLPDISDNQVLVKVKYASLNAIDFQIKNSLKHNESFIPCSDFSGVVVKVGEKVKKFEIGDEVFGIADFKNGACAEYIAVSQDYIGIKPFSLSFAQAAIIPTPGIYAWNMIEKAKISEGSSVLLDEAFSETGAIIGALAKNNSAQTTAIDDKTLQGFALSFYIDNFIPNNKLSEMQNDLISKFDVVFDLNGGLKTKDLQKFVKSGGYFITGDYIGNDSIRKDINFIDIRSSKDNKVFAKVARLVHLGKINIKVYKSFKLDQFREAFMRSEKGNIIAGDIAIQISKD
jgi:alcohol dehydrogenase